MTEQIKSAIEREKEEADRYQSKYDNNFNNPNVLEEWRETQADEAEYHQTIAEWLEDYVKCKKAWEEVLQELEEMKCEYDCTTNEFQRGANAGANFIRNKAIEIIKQKLSEIEE